MKLSLLSGLASVLLIATAFAQEQIYRWQDERGNVHYGSAPPPGVRAEPQDTHIQPGAASPGEKVYTWKDEQGYVHYGDRPPARGESRQLDTDATTLSTIRRSIVRPGEPEPWRK